jgi:hypothetical protein
MQTPGQAAGIKTPKLHKSAIDYEKVLDAGDVGIGVGKGIAHTLGTIGSGEYNLMPKALQNTAYGRNFGAGLNAVDEAATPTNTPQKIGHGIEQAAEFLIPGGAEEQGALKLAKFAPKLGKFAKPAAKVVTSALGAGAVNAAQGGSALEGAAMGAGGRAVGEAAGLLAPTLTGVAQGLKPEDYQKTGTAILNETKGIFPGQVRRSARKTLDVLNPELDQAAIAAGTDQAGNLINPVSLAPARTVGQEEVARQVGRSNPKMFKGVQRMANQLEVDPLGNPIPEDVTPFRALELKRGIGQAQPKGSWSPESANAFKGPRTSIYKTLNEGFENAVPEAVDLNRRISSLIPATKPPQNIFWGHALGPAVGGLYGGLRGAHSGGFEGAAAGALEGAALGLAIPAGLNTVARGAYSPMARNLIIPAATGATLQATRKKKEKE